MLAIKFTFIANRYHATQWGRQVNEGVPEWPPSSWRILRGIVATWRRTLTDLAPDRVVPTLEALASELPRFKLPTASTGHTRHFMPYHEGVRERTTLVIDQFVAIKPHAPVFAMWPNVELTSQQRNDLDSILRNMPYLGRAESWVEAEVASDYPEEADSFPIETGAIPEGDWEIVRTLVPRAPLRLKDLEAETSELRRSGRIDPEGAQWWTYVRKPNCFTRFRAAFPEAHEQGEGAQVVRFALVGRPLPMSFDTLRWGELARRSVMSQYGRQNGGMASQTLSGKDPFGKPLEGHGHAFYLPTDEDGDGRLDHITMWARAGLASNEFRAILSVNELNPGRQRDPVQLAYQAHGAIGDFAGVSPLFGNSKRWRSLTPYVLTRHVKFRGPKDEKGRRNVMDSPEQQIAREVSLRWATGPSLVSAEIQEDQKSIAPMHEGQSSGFRAFDFFRYKQGGGSNGGRVCNFEIEFENPVHGPVALGFACHHGLGIFVPVRM